MTINELIMSPWLPLIIAIICFIYGAVILKSGDPYKARRSGDTTLLKDSDAYAKMAGWLIIFMGVGCVVMSLIIVLTANDGAATVESVVWFIIFAALWRRMDIKYGPM